MEKTVIKIVIEGGCLVDIENLPDNIEYEIVDLDVTRGMSDKKEKTYWYDHKPSDNNNGYIYGINYIEDGEIIDCQWFKTMEERDNQITRGNNV